MATAFETLLKQKILERNLAPKTFKTYFHWSKVFYGFTKRGFRSCGAEDVGNFLTWMKRERYSEASRKQALNALNFIYKHVFDLPLGDIGPAAYIKVRKAPVIAPTVGEVGRIFSGMSGMPKLMALMMYGSGLRISEICKLRVKDLDFNNSLLYIYESKGNKHRTTVLSSGLIPLLKTHLAWRNSLHQKDLHDGFGFVELPGRYGQKNRAAERSLEWQFLFPSTAIRKGFRWYTSDRLIQKNFAKAVQAAGITKRLTPHSLRKGFATHLHNSGAGARSVQNLLGHAKLETTLSYIEANDPASIQSPVDKLL